MCLSHLNPTILKCPASQKWHQAYPGGLIVHMTEVMEASLWLAKSQFLSVDIDALITGVVYHDLGKLDEYSVNETTGEISYTKQKQLIGHLSMSYAIFMQDATNWLLNDDITEKIGHIILAHHGRKEWGSPVEPVLTEAYIIHFADMLSSRVAQTTYIRN
jgi:3'-5' exoribonuclease